MDRYVYCPDETRLPDAIALADRLVLQILTSTPELFTYVCELADGISVIAVPSIREFNSAQRRHYLSGHSIFINDDFSNPSEYSVTYISPSGFPEAGLKIRAEHESATFYGQLGEVGTWTIVVENKDGVEIFRDFIEAVDEPLTK